MKYTHNETAKPTLERMHLEILSAVDRDGSLTAAAKALHLTQSALSHSIRKLEDSLGVAIWRRKGRALRLTQAGEYLLAVANRIAPQFGSHPAPQTGRGAVSARSLRNR